MEDRLNTSEFELLNELCELNENLIITVSEVTNIYVYRSRFLNINLGSNSLIIDEPSPETANAKPLSKNQLIKIFFIFKNQRYSFETRVFEHTIFKVKEKGFYALKINCPKHLDDGERREYFRVETPAAPLVVIRFNVFKFDVEKREAMIPEKISDTLEEFEAILVNISGGGIGIREIKGQKPLDLTKGDVLLVKLKLRSDLEEMKIWTEIRYRRIIPDTETQFWGSMYIISGRNLQLKICRNKIMKYIVDRQKEMMA